MVIQHNIMAINAHRQLGVNNTNLQKNLEKLSSGYRINRAADDAAGLAISEKMRSQITGLDRAVLNAKDGASLIQTAEGALTEVHSMLNRMVELSTQSANGTIQDVDRNKVESELTALKSEIDRISQATDFNGIKLLDGSLSAGVAKFGSAPSLAASVFGANSSYSIVNKVDISLPNGVYNELGTFTVTTADNGVIKLAFSGTLTKFDRTINLTTAGLYTQVGGKNTFTLRDDQGGIWGTVTVENKKTGKAEDVIKDLCNLVSASFGGHNTIAVSGSKTPLRLQVGDTAESFNQINVSVDDMGVNGLGIKDIHMNTQDLAAEALGKVKNAIEVVSRNRGNLGALQNRLEHTINNLGVASENMTAAESRIRDVDMAKEMMNFTKNNVLSQAAQSMLAQANMQPQQVLQLLR